MVNMLAHGVFAAAVNSLMSGILSGEPLTAGAFIACIIAMLMDFDESETRRGVLHGLDNALIFCCTSIAVILSALYAGMVEPGLAVELAAAVIIGAVSHLALDELALALNESKGAFSEMIDGEWMMSPQRLNVYVTMPSFLLIIGLLAVL